MDNTQLNIYWSNTRICKIFNSALTDEELKTFWRQYQELKDNCLKDIPPEIAKEDDLVYYWESNFQAERLQFIKDYIDSSLTLLRNMRCLVKGGGVPPPFLVLIIEVPMLSQSMKNGAARFAAAIIQAQTKTFVRT